ncbi:eCIS core domain-containing protein [Undibacterium sp. Ji49W]|uniref:eCIS core domain-containing protein n=1 Tax=Undibacterium sp. Ji49W TaxID=3413040 RepID=UPI003BF0E800
MSSAMPMQDAQIEAPKNNASQGVQLTVGNGSQLDGKLRNGLSDNRAQAISQRRLSEIANNSNHAKKLQAYQLMAQTSERTLQLDAARTMMDAHVLRRNSSETDSAKGVAQTISKTNNTGLSDSLKSSIENLSGLSMNHVKVHYNSSKPAQLNAHAYAQGSEIHVAPGQEQHVPHEAWHVVQQAQGRVAPTMQMKGGVPVNDNVALEREADIMGAKAFASDAAIPVLSTKREDRHLAAGNGTAQLALATYDNILDEGAKPRWTHLHTRPADKNGTIKGRGARAEKSEEDWETKVTWGPTSRDDGTLMVANPLGPDHGLGSPPASDGNWSVKRRKQQERAGGKEYKAGHLLNAKLGGMGNDARNLAAIPAEANSNHAAKVENKIEKLVNKHHAWVDYKVETKQDQDLQTLGKPHYTSALICEWHQLDKGKNQVSDSEGKVEIKIPPPSDVANDKKSTFTSSGKGLEKKTREENTEWTKVSRKQLVLKDTETLSAQKLVMGPINRLLDEMKVSVSILDVENKELSNNYFAIVEATEIDSDEQKAYEEIASANENMGELKLSGELKWYEPPEALKTALITAQKKRTERYEKIESAVETLYKQLHTDEHAVDLFKVAKKAQKKEESSRKDTEQLCSNLIFLATHLRSELEKSSEVSYSHIGPLLKYTKQENIKQELPLDERLKKLSKVEPFDHSGFHSIREEVGSLSPMRQHNFRIIMENKSSDNKEASENKDKKWLEKVLEEEYLDSLKTGEGKRHIEETLETIHIVKKQKGTASDQKLIEYLNDVIDIKEVKSKLTKLASEFKEEVKHARAYLELKKWDLESSVIPAIEKQYKEKPIEMEEFFQALIN